ncbi:hypothetical protein HDE_04246 [Halotydeus destructor]|nr:hypothetical protein HDE_04246 [Halotydeus destructor]
MAKRKLDDFLDSDSPHKTHSSNLIDAWIQVAHSLVYEITETEVDQLLTDESAMTDMLNRTLSRWLDTRPLHGLKQRIDEFHIDIVVFTNGSKCKILCNEPIYFAPTLKFITEPDDQLISQRKRYVMFMVNLQKLKELVDILDDAILNSASGMDSGMVDLADELDDEFTGNQLVNPKFLKCSLMISLLALHSLGHFDLFLKHHFAFYDNHKPLSFLHHIMKQLKTYQIG